MNNNKHRKPNLMDPLIEKKIIKTLKMPTEDYWAPTKSTFRSFFREYIRPNISLIIFIVIIILFLIYRYRTIKHERENREIEKIYETAYGFPYGNPSIKHIDHIDHIDYAGYKIPQINKNTQSKQISKKNIDEYTNLLLNAYNLQKENMREPNIKKINNRINPAPTNNFAYPMYPYGRTGSLAPSGSR